MYGIFISNFLHRTPAIRLSFLLLVVCVSGGPSSDDNLYNFRRRTSKIFIFSYPTSETLYM